MTVVQDRYKSLSVLITSIYHGYECPAENRVLLAYLAERLEADVAEGMIPAIKYGKQKALACCEKAWDLLHRIEDDVENAEDEED